jgi:hypothetical protein
MSNELSFLIDYSSYPRTSIPDSHAIPALREAQFLPRTLQAFEYDFGYKINFKVIRLVDWNLPVEYIFPSLCLILVHRFTGHQPTLRLTERQCLADHRRRGFSKLWTLIELQQITGLIIGVLCSYLCSRR